LAGFDNNISAIGNYSERPNGNQQYGQNNQNMNTEESNLHLRQHDTKLQLENEILRNNLNKLKKSL